jgi:hypothetical protein
LLAVVALKEDEEEVEEGEAKQRLEKEVGLWL